MTRRLSFVLAVLLFLLPAVAGCGAPKQSAFDAIKTYRDIADADEIRDIEKLKESRDSLIYGALHSTEAFENADGEKAGFTASLCGLLSDLFGIKFVLKLYEDKNELSSDFESGAIDFTGEWTSERARAGGYINSLSIAERMLRIYTFKGPASPKVRTETDIIGLNIGFLKGATAAEAIKNIYPVVFNAVPVEDYAEAKAMLIGGDIDAFLDEAVADPLFESPDFASSPIFFPLVYSPVTMAAKKPALKPFLTAVDKYLAKGGVDKMYQFYKDGDLEYAKQKLYNSFSPQEKAYVDGLKARKEAVAVAYEHDNYPVNFYNEKDRKFQGMAVDVLAEISTLTGVSFRPAVSKNTTFKEIYDKVKAGDIPMAGQILEDEEREKYFIWADSPYGKSNYAFISKDSYPLLASYQIVHARVGVMTQSQKITVYKKFFPAAAADPDEEAYDLKSYTNVTEYPTQNDCLNALEKGEIDLYFASEYTLLIQTHYREKSGFKLNLRLNAPMYSNFGFNKEQTVLRSVVERAQEFVDVAAIETNWTTRTFDYSRKLSHQRNIFMLILSIMLLAILAGMSTLLVKNLKLSKRLKVMANHDGLTGIFNRRYFMEQSAVQIERALRGGGGDCFVAIYDLDNFKLVNDIYGHLAGDKVLRDIAQRVKKIIRPYDLFGRYGGEEFIIFMPGIDKEGAVAAAERIRKEICREPVEFEDKQLSVSASFGVACAAPKNDLHKAVEYADEALYQAKEGGRNRVAFREQADNEGAEGAESLQLTF